MTTADLLAAVKRTQGLTSTASLARALNVPEKSVYRWQQGKHTPDDATTARLAALAGLDAGEVVAAINAERAAEPEVRELWTSIAKRLHATAAAAMVAVAFTGTPDAGAYVRGAAPAPADHSGDTLYIM